MAFVDEHQLSWATWAISDKYQPPSLFKLGGSLTENGKFVKEQPGSAAVDAPWR